MTKIHPSAADQFLMKDTEWFTVDYGYAAMVLRDCVDNYKTYLEKGKRQAYVAREAFNLELMANEFVDIVDSALNSVPKQVQLNLPKLNKVGTTNAGVPKITLPKLNKVTV